MKLFFTVVPKEHLLNYPINHSEMSNLELRLKDLIFLGVTINSGADTAIGDGLKFKRPPQCNGKIEIQLKYNGNEKIT